MFEAFAKRKAAEQLEARRVAHISALYANPNLDSQKEGEEGQRREILESIEKIYDDILFDIYNPGIRKKIEEISREEFKKNPFFAAMRLPKVDEIDYGDAPKQVQEMRRSHEQAIDDLNIDQ